jgi:fumarate hydratase class II
VSDSRIERDTMGEVRVPANALWGAQTQRALENFPVSGRRFPRVFLAALAHVKAACAEVNDLPDDLRQALRDAAEQVASGKHDDQFPLDVFQSGSGTSTNMNMNEVIATLAARALRRGVHPNDDVNRSQSSNDVIPTAANLSALLSVRDDLLPAVRRLEEALERKAKEWAGLVKLGRTHLMDAMPLTLGQEFGGYAAQLRKAREGIEHAAQGIHELPIGGTAVGTGVNAPRGFGNAVSAILARRLGLPVREAANPFEAQASRDGLLALSGALKVLAAGLTKIANDLRWMNALRELALPGLQPGSSIMPGKVNPVMSEMMVQVAAQVIGNDGAITIGAQGGAFELNAMMPVMISNLLESISILARGSRLFAEKCVDGLVANEARLRELADRTAVAATVLAPKLGYERVAQLVKEADGGSVKDLAVRKGLITPEEAERLFDPKHLGGSI